MPFISHQNIHLGQYLTDWMVELLHIITKKFRKSLVKSDFLCYHMFCSLDMPACRNGRRGRLKICCGQPRMGSSPIAGST